MQKKKMWRYYCDHCKKSGGSKYHMERHENTCTNNPNRTCMMCQYDLGGGCGHDDFKVMISIVEEATITSCDNSILGGVETTCFKVGWDSKRVLDRLHEITICPACILAAMRQGAKAPMFKDVFDYKEEKKEFWSVCNEERQQSRYY